jgi:hypothetical protein
MNPPLEPGVRGEDSARNEPLSTWILSVPSAASSARWPVGRAACVDVAADIAVLPAGHSTAGWQHGAAALCARKPAAGAATRRGAAGRGEPTAVLLAPLRSSARRESSRISSPVDDTR